ncbi:hypothetical protein PYCCODRAFT_1474843 [Trametes coccinea BRFM310]|uniref:Uncharacterized protein n=1 Tax=Trametes coccinea (strain BRFM310) TaxID=1353009 RepID=A0A1Y2IXV6_TRAC3|nr:hypothetical protein PYCCODRAFT_1474843 [Trametes coccinea BRFM310]
MASTDGALQVQQSLNEEQSNATPAVLNSAPTDGATDAPEAFKPVQDASERSAGQPSPAPSSPASGVSTTKSGPQPPSVSGQSNPPPLSMPHPKKFSHVNINKKFLEKTSASTPSHPHSASPVTKTPISSQKPALQTSTSHPRLVTAKLTATPQPSTTTGPGWSRPSSAVSSTAPTPLSAGSSKASPAPAPAAGGAPLPPPVGKVIQPQPRSVQDTAPQRRDAPNKPAWGNTRASAPSAPKLDGVRNDFPTAAEVAQGRASQATTKNEATDAANMHKKAVMAELQAEEDTFRGVHLDPNAHHWDEMEEDDDNFLGGVIEFGDGRQYKVQFAESSQHTQPQHDTKPSASDGTEAPVSNESVDKPVSKEERFVDDFDRSWPPSRPTHHAPGQHRDQRSDGHPVSPSTTSHSPSESSRVLFNERSNRLEPYSHQRHGPPPATFNRRGSRSDNSISPIEPRRDAPPHTQLQGVQLLQKGGQPDGHTFSRAPGGDRPPGPHDGSRFRDRQPFQRDHGPWQTNGHPGPDRHPGAFGPPHPPRDASFDDRARRPPMLEPPNVDHRRQLPPHLSVVGSRHPPPIRTDGPVAPQPPSLPREPPPPSAASQAATSPATTDKGLPATTLPAVDLDEARKAAMHIAAERARLRRQQEEEEREKERERARRKAAELEAKIKAMEEEKARERQKAEAEKSSAEAQAVGIIEEAVSSAATVESKPGASDVSAQRPDARPELARNVSARGTARPFGTRKASLTPSAQSVSLPPQPSPASEADTWRRKAAPSSAAPPQSEAQKPAATPMLPPPVLAHADLDVKAGEEVEVMDFSDHGRLVGSEDKPYRSGAAARPARAVASDFFGDSSTSPQRTRPLQSRGEEESSWRRPSHTFVDKPSAPAMGEESRKPQVLPAQAPPPQHHGGVPSGLQTTTGAHPPMHEEHLRRISSHYQNGVPRPALGSSYREAPMSALDDTLSRIKGALDGMHHHETEAPKPQKWLPPALRSRSAHSDFAHPTEVFDVTSAEPPRSPKPAWNNFHVKLPHASRPVPPQETELIWPRGRRPFKLDVHSFHPPIHALNSRDATVTDHLFGRPRFVRGQPKYFVSIPRRKITRRLPPSEASSTPVVHLPSTPTRTRNPALPKESVASNATTWRKGPSAATTLPAAQDEVKESTELDTVSRSPPPEVPSAASAVSSLPKAAESLASPSTAAAPASKHKPEPRMPAGSDVAFYRNSRVETAVESQPPVQFIVSSELEGEPTGQLNGAKPAETTVQAAKPQEPMGGSSASGLSSLTSDQKAPGPLGVANGISAATPPQPPSQPAAQPSLSPWTKSPKSLSIKESPSRAPDPEHLKAVWSQTSDKAQIQPVNSLRGIADDLTGVPFSLQDVKSDDGGTPPPSGSGTWSRMSSYEVTRAFQQVPSPSSSSSQRPGSIAPSTSTSTNGSSARHPGFAISPPPMGQPALRPAYSVYSPMMSHSPAPSVMYSHPSPVPRHMVANGSAPAYGQAVWVPAMHTTAPPPSAGMIRSPYGPQMVPYPSPGAAMYPAPVPMQNPSQQNGVQGRPPSMAMMSPVMQPAMSPMYAGSPVLVPTMAPGQGYPMPSQATRAPGPMRPYEQNPQNGQHMNPSPMRQPPQNGYNPVPSGYARPPW